MIKGNRKAGTIFMWLLGKENQHIQIPQKPPTQVLSIQRWVSGVNPREGLPDSGSNSYREMVSSLAHHRQSCPATISYFPKCFFIYVHFI